MTTTKTEALIIDGIKCYAPELAYSNEDFNAASFKQLFELEEHNFWFRARNRVIQTLVQKYSNSITSGLSM